MNEPSSASRTPFIIILILLLAITGVQYFFNFNGLGTDAAMDHAQIARNVARGQGMTTNWLRPIQMVSGSTRAGLNPFLSDAQIHEQEAIRAGQGETLVDPEKFNPYALRDTRNAPLNILTEAAVFRMAGVHKFDLWSMTVSSMIYLCDLFVACISCMFFILSVLSCYYILLRMFDVTIACFTCLTMILSNLFLQYATSGLPQMMMLFFFAWGIHFLYTALQNKEENRAFLWPLIGSSICFSCVCLTGWIGLWPMAGFLIFAGIRFKPHGLYCIPGLITLLLFLAYPIYINRSLSGGFFGTAYYTIFTGLTGNEEIAMNALVSGSIPIAAQKVVTSVINNILTQGDLLYENLGNLPLAMVFLLALLHKFKRPEVNQSKWGIFAMWVPAVIGMAIYTSNKTGISLGQIQILFAPFFTAYGTAFVLNLIARHSNKELISILRGGVLLLSLLITSLPLLLNLPHIVRVGILTAGRGIPAWPPYYPLGLNRDLRTQTAEKDFILTDQPSAVGWYADRKAIGIPKMVEQFMVLERILKFHGGKVGSILVTPSSTSKMNLRTISSSYGEFTPLVLEGTVLFQTKDKNPVYIFDHSRALAPLAQRFGTPDSRQFIQGAEMILYKDLQETAPQP